MNRVPKLRFKEFNGEWCINQIKELVKKEIIAKPLDGNHGSLHPVSSDYVEEGIPFIMANDITNVGVDLKKCKKISKAQAETLQKGFSKEGDVLLTHKGTIGRTCIVQPIKTEYIILTPQVTYYRVKNLNILNNKFIKNYFESEKFNKNLLKASSSGTRPYIGITEQLELTINFPVITEQQKIADFLSSVDKKISITEEKLDLLKEYKKGIMQKIFKQELRFKNSEGKDYPEWEEKILGKIIIKNKEKNKENKYNLVQSISNKFGFVNQDEYFEDRRVASQDLKNYYVAKNKLFAYNPSRINVGSLAYKEDNNISVISPLYVSFYSNKEYLIDKFLFNWLFSSPFIKQMSCSFEGSVRNNLSFETLSNFIIELPCLEEQEKIANFLSSIDNKIDNLAVELENLKEFKKGLLQQMFV